MTCAWREFLSILPQKLRKEVDRLGKESLQELRLRINSPPELVLGGSRYWLSEPVTLEELNHVVNMASRYSPWAATTAAQGYLTAPGGHRIGLCGTAVCKDGVVTGMRELTSLCIRVARDYPGIGREAETLEGSILILGAPGWGKTTLLRDVIRKLSEKQTVCVIDERGEVFPDGFERGSSVDILKGCEKKTGLPMALRTMGPEVIAVDEITEAGDSEALLQAAHCGVRLLATAHASSIFEFKRRKIYQLLVDNGVFCAFLVLHKDKTYHVERLTV